MVVVQRWSLCIKVFQSKLVSKLAWPDLAWPLLTGGRCSEVAVNTGLTLTVITIIDLCKIDYLDVETLKKFLHLPENLLL